MRSVLAVPSYEEAVSRFTMKVVKGFASLDELLRLIPMKTTEHAGPIRNVPGQLPLDQPRSLVEGETLLDLDIIRSTDVQGYAVYLWELSHSILQNLKAELLRSMAEVTDATGMRLDAQEEPFSFSMVIDMLEKMDLRFDENGQLIPPALILPPKLSQRVRSTKPTSEEEKRFTEVIDRKRAEYYAQKRTRRLS